MKHAVARMQLLLNVFKLDIYCYMNKGGNQYMAINM